MLKRNNGGFFPKLSTKLLKLLVIGGHARTVITVEIISFFHRFGKSLGLTVRLIKRSLQIRHSNLVCNIS